jgi:hypothetical protein
MLSITNGTPIARFIDDKYKPGEIIYMTKKTQTPQLQTTNENKLDVFISFLRSKQLRQYEIDKLVTAYQTGDELRNDKLGKIYDDAIESVKDSDFNYMKFEDIECMPIVDMRISKRFYILGGSGSGKTFFVTKFIILNRVSLKQPVFYFSPFGDEGLPGIKNLINVDIANWELENEREITIDDIPKDSIVVFDDCDSYKSTHKKKLIEFRNSLLETGRHYNISTFVINHIGMQGVPTKACLSECNYFVCFQNNEHYIQNLLKTYGNMKKSEIDNMISSMGRYVFISRSIPKYYISNNMIKLF